MCQVVLIITENGQDMTVPLDALAGIDASANEMRTMSFLHTELVDRVDDVWMKPLRDMMEKVPRC